jgi:hypothetical protein
METRENFPSTSELTQEAADMVEGNRKLAEQTREDPERGAGYTQERTELESQLTSARSAVEDYKKALEPDNGELLALELKLGKSGLNQEEQLRVEKLQQRVTNMNARLTEKEALVQQLKDRVGRKQKDQESLGREQEHAAKYSEEHAIESVVTSKTLHTKGLKNNELADQEVALRHRVPAELKQREAVRKEAADQAKAEQLIKEDREILDSVKQQFESLKAQLESGIQTILDAANAPENLQKVQGSLKKIQQLEGAWFKKGEKHNEASREKDDLERWINKNFNSRIFELSNTALGFLNKNSPRGYGTTTKNEQPALNQIYLYRYQDLPKSTWQAIDEESKALLKEIDAYRLDFQENRIPKLVAQAREHLGMPPEEE